MKEALKARSLMVGVLVAAMVLSATTALARNERDDRRNHSQLGVVLNGDEPIADAEVTILQAGTRAGRAKSLGSTVTDAQGRFVIDYRLNGQSSVLYLVVDGPRPEIRLATVLGASDFPEFVVVNELTTIATAYAMAQFIDGDSIGGPKPGVPNAASVFRNVVELADGEIGSVLGNPPNGDETSALRTVNMLANMLVPCIRSGDTCDELFDFATPPGGDSPTDTLAAMVDIAHNPSHDVEGLVALAQLQQAYSPSLTLQDVDDPSAEYHINSLVLPLRYEGQGPDGPVMDGPGNIAFDSEGSAWINNNYAYNSDPSVVTCGSTLLIKLLPNGQPASGSPFGGNDVTQDGVGAGGLYGAGYGIAVDPNDRVWVTNFGFQGQSSPGEPPSGCDNMAADLAVSVSQFDSSGRALSPDGDPSDDSPGGYVVADGSVKLGQPQGVQSDKQGNVWVAGCIDGTVTRFRRGSPDRAQIMRVQDSELVDEFDRAFDVAIDRRGHAWVTGNKTSNVVEIDRQFRVVTELSDGIDMPMGIASDSAGNMWVADAGLPNPPCPPLLGDDPSDQIGDDGSRNLRAAVSLIDTSGREPAVEKFGRFSPGEPDREGLRWPWGIAVDGDDNVWVANFTGQRVMNMCGAQPATCPDGKTTGDPLSPDEGYFFGGFERITAVQIDPSGNVWMTNNWLLDGFTNPENPGGYQVVVFVGLAAPVKTPLLGPPRQP